MFLLKHLNMTSGCRCALSYCTSIGTKGNPLSFFKFPKNHLKCASWVLKCEARYLPTIDFDALHKTYKLCSLHFEHHMFSSKNRLIPRAMPTVFVQKPVSIVAESANNSLVESKYIESNQSILKNDDISISLINDLPPCSTPGTSMMLDISVSNCIDKFETTAGTQTPGYLPLKMPRILHLQKKLAEAEDKIKKLEVSYKQLTNFLEKVNAVDNILHLVEKYASPTLFIMVKKSFLSKDKTLQRRRFSN